MADGGDNDGAGWLMLGGLGLNAAGQIWSNYRNERNNKQRFLKSVELANTAHQREVADLRAAGLNPLLSATGGNGAPSPDISAATVDNPASSALQVASIYNQHEQAVAQNKAADAAKLNSETQAWQIYDARTMGYAGFDVGVGKHTTSSGFLGKVGKAFGFGADGSGKYERVYTIRVNKVTGEAYTVPDNKRITSFRPVEQSEVNSAGSTGKPSAAPDKPLVIKVHKSASGKPDYRRDNPFDREIAPMY